MSGHVRACNIQLGFIPNHQRISPTVRKILAKNSLQKIFCFRSMAARCWPKMSASCPADPAMPYKHRIPKRTDLLPVAFVISQFGVRFAPWPPISGGFLHLVTLLGGFSSISLWPLPRLVRILNVNKEFHFSAANYWPYRPEVIPTSILMIL